MFHYVLQTKVYVDCLEDTEVLTISPENKEQLFKASPKMEYFFHKNTTIAYTTLQKWLLCVQMGSADERYAHMIEHDPNLIHRIPETMLASYLQIPKESLSRFLK